MSDRLLTDPAFLPRRNFLAALGGVAGSLMVGARPAAGQAISAAKIGADRTGPLFRISLAQWSLHRQLRSGELDNLDFASYARERFDIGAVEYVNSFFKEHAGDFDYLGQMKANAEAADVKSLIIMIDGEGLLADADPERRRRAIENHFKWLAAAGFLGCHSIRVNAGGSGGYEEQMKNAADSLRRLAEVADPYGLNIIVENHGGLSSNGAWLAGVMKQADHPRVGTLPDFGNFHLGGGEWYDRYDGVRELMPYAKAVSAKSHEFDEDGNEVKTDYRKMLKIVLEAGYRGYVGIEYEGGKVSEEEGIGLTKGLLVRVRGELEAG